MKEQGPVRIPKDVLEELGSLRRRYFGGVEVLDVASLRYVAVETHKPALTLWIDEHEQEYGRGLLDGFVAEEG